MYQGFDRWLYKFAGEVMVTKNEITYYEAVSSKRTEWLFLTLTFLFFLLFIWRVKVSGWNGLAAVFLVFFCFFLFYSVNYRTLIISLTSESLKLSFGIFTWIIPLDNIASCSLDELPALMKFGGAGVHFMNIRKRYRASFSFLEHPRVVIALKSKMGPVRDISFSTRRPDNVLRLIQKAIPI